MKLAVAAYYLGEQNIVCNISNAVIKIFYIVLTLLSAMFKNKFSFIKMKAFVVN
jgi:hypothetical protein